jgi:ketosteroid isomerase-like protein
MKRFVVLAILLLVGTVLVFGQESQKTEKAEKKAAAKSEKKSGSVEDQINKFEEEWANGAMKGDTSVIERLEADDIISTDPSGKVTDKQQDVQALKSGELKFETVKLSDMKVRVYGNTAVATGTNMVKGSYKGQDISGSYRFTDTWVKRNGKWQAVASQATKITE